MTAEYASSAKPRWAVTAWTDANNVFIEIPIKDKPPFISKYPLTAEGLGLALGQMRKFHTVESGPQQYTIPPRLAANQAKYPADTRAKTLAILRKHGIL